ncbi:MAG: ABC transporter ATP-binding protein [Tissierellia bacterium]|nr:ABC transporter ATP-binding protein [Tissierellia bacterium]
MTQQIGSQDLKIGYGDHVVLEDINFQLERGQILCLMGPNGSGKSTLIKTLIHQQKKLGGKIYLEEKEMESLKNIERASKMSAVLTERLSLDLMTAEEIVATGRFPYTNFLGKLEEEDFQAIDQALDMVKAQAIKDRPFSQLSDGQKQRIMLARAICQGADIMILDEPTSFLDVRYKIEILGILKNLSRQMNKTLILSLHEIDLISKIADQVLQINGDQTYSYGSPDQVLKDQAIKAAFSIKEGSYSSLLGNIELEAPKGEAKVFVVGGCGRGIKTYRRLNKEGVAFYAGILFENDLDLAVARPLAKKTLVEKAFRDISQDTIQRAKDLIDQVDYVLDVGADFVGANRGNQALLDYSLKKAKKLIFLKERPGYGASSSYQLEDLL